MCIRFRALREHVVGRTSALPVSVYDYYEPGRPALPSRTPARPFTLSLHHVVTGPAPLAAFEATRFYNVSAHSPLARELCAGPECNEVERSAAQGPGECARPLPLAATPTPPAGVGARHPPGAETGRGKGLAWQRRTGLGQGCVRHGGAGLSGSGGVQGSRRRLRREPLPPLPHNPECVEAAGPPVIADWLPGAEGTPRPFSLFSELIEMSLDCF